MTGRYRHPKAGVTLLETLVALLIMALIGLLLSGSIGHLARLMMRGTTASENLQSALARRDLRVWMEHALSEAPPNDNRVVFQGERDRLRALVLPMDAPFWPGFPTEIDVSSKGTVMATGMASMSGPPLNIHAELLAGSGTVSIRYWGQVRPNAPFMWHDEWDGGDGLPSLMKIAFHGTPSPIPPLVIRPAKAWLQSERSLSSLVPPGRPSRP